jgi:hypothetical protein
MPTADERAEALLDSPAGCVLLLIAEEHDLTPEDLARHDIGLAAIASAVAQISPWSGSHDRMVRHALDERDRLRERALHLASHPGIAWWWEPVDREHQLWLPQHDGFICPDEVWELRPRGKPSSMERYVHEPRPVVSTSNAYGNLSPELAHVLVFGGDWDLEFPINIRHVTIRHTARILELNSAREWHDLVRRYPADGYHATHPDDFDTPWGVAEGMVVPDWRAISFDWDGVHITPWAYLTANQVRITSDISWTEPWSWEGPHTVWLDWMFDSLDDLPPVEEDTFDLPHFSVEALSFSDPLPSAESLQPVAPLTSEGWSPYRGGHRSQTP